MTQKLQVRIETIASWWCRQQHTAIWWPMRGEYACATCGRRYAVPWEARVPERPNTRIDSTSSDHQTVTVWAPHPHDSKPGLPVF